MPHDTILSLPAPPIAFGYSLLDCPINVGSANDSFVKLYFNISTYFLLVPQYC